MTFTDAACEVLRLSGCPLHYKEITELAIEKNLLSHVGKSPEVTMGARLAATLKKGGDTNPLVRVKPGVFALRDWDEETIKKGLEIKRAPRRAKADKAKDTKTEKAAAKPTPKAEKAAEPEAPKAAEPAAKAAETKAVELPDTPPSPDEELRAEIAASAKEVFAAEDDDDQPILKQPEEEPEPVEGRRRRRRRRRRGSRGGNTEQQDSGLPSYTATPAFESESSSLPRGPQVIELAGGDVPAMDNLVGRDLADGIAMVLGSFDRTVGAVSLRQIAETAQRRGKLSGDVQLAQSQIAAAVRADNARRCNAGYRPRFRLAGGRVGLTDWLLDSDLARYERDVQTALGRYQDAVRKAFARKCAELPGHAFVELCVLALERIGVTKLRQVRYPGSSGAEAQLSAVLNAPAGALLGRIGTGVGTKLAIVIRKDGRDIGRERVTELRGSVHHYEDANAGWIFSAGQVLSGARDEAGADGAVPVMLLDGIAIARLCEEHGVAVVQSKLPMSIPDVDLFEALRAS